MTTAHDCSRLSAPDEAQSERAVPAATALLPLESLFREHAQQNWIFVMPGGNWGDILIYRGAEHLAKRVGLHVRTFSLAAFAEHRTGPQDCIYVHGGGGLNSWCSGAAFRAFKEATSRRCAAVVFGPQTYEAGNRELIEQQRSAIASRRADRIALLARERTSLEVLGQLDGSDAQIGLDHDTAMHLDREAILEIVGLNHLPAGRYPLVVVRTDAERVGNAAGATPVSGVQIDTAFEAVSFPHWLKLHLYAKSIHSDRLHSAIVGALLGKPVTLYQGSYHKNRSLWEFSLRDRGVHWGNGVLSAAGVFSRLPARLQTCHKMRRLRNLVCGVPSR